MVLRVGLIGGTGFDHAGPGESLPVETSDGDVELTLLRWGRHTVFFLPRHGARHEFPPHRVRYRAHAEAFAACHVDYVLAVYNCGGLDSKLRRGAWAVPADLLDGTRQRPRTLFEDRAVHVDMTEPYCPHVRAALLQEIPRAHDGGVYVAVDGPRFDTAAEAQNWSRQGGTLIGMTGVPEAVFARELGQCYGALCFVANAAHGTSVLRAQAVQANLASRVPTLRRLLPAVASRLAIHKTCRCAARTRHANVTRLAVRGSV